MPKAPFQGPHELFISSRINLFPSAVFLKYHSRFIASLFDE